VATLIAARKRIEMSASATRMTVAIGFSEATVKSDETCSPMRAEEDSGMVQSVQPSLV